MIFWIFSCLFFISNAQYNYSKSYKLSYVRVYDISTVGITELCNVTECEGNGGLCTSYSCKYCGFCRCENCPHLKTGPCCDLNIASCNESDSICNGHGFCDDSIGSISCECDSGWAGDYCMINLDYCTSNHCVHGTCVDNIEPGFTCMCEPMYTGENCNELMCPDGYCKNGGTCTVNTDTISCSCADGYSGNYCETDECYCDDDTCTVQGEYCREYEGAISNCSCLDNDCSNASCITDPCSCQPCFNGGTCVSSNLGSFQCMCPPGISCGRCEHDIIDACIANPCANGGTCIDGPGYNYTCVCKPEYTGVNCTVETLYCPLFNSSLCTSCVEGNGANISCLYCPDVCKCLIESCSPNYCVHESAKCNPKGIESVICLHSISNVNVTQSCDCIIPKLSTSTSSSHTSSQPSILPTSMHFTPLYSCISSRSFGPDATSSIFITDTPILSTNPTDSTTPTLIGLYFFIAGCVMFLLTICFVALICILVKFCSRSDQRMEYEEITSTQQSLPSKSPTADLELDLEQFTLKEEKSKKGNVQNNLLKVLPTEPMTESALDLYNNENENSTDIVIQEADSEDDENPVQDVDEMFLYNMKLPRPGQRRIGQIQYPEDFHPLQYDVERQRTLDCTISEALYNPDRFTIHRPDRTSITVRLENELGENASAFYF